MGTFIATKIEEAAEISLEKGQAKYRAYFVRKVQRDCMENIRRM